MARWLAPGIAAYALIALTGTASAITYAYDDLDRLVEVVYDDGSVLSYTYDAGGNRLSRVFRVDPDADGVFYAGGANPCAGGATAGCEDNCPLLANADQEDFDGDASGDTCDDDDDGDTLLDIHESDTRIYISPTDTGTDPLNPDTDGDGFRDDEEVAAGSDPNDGDSYPGSPTPIPALGPAGSTALGIAMAALGLTALRRRRRSRS